MLPKLGRHHGGFFPFCFVLSNKLIGFIMLKRWIEWSIYGLNIYLYYQIFLFWFTCIPVQIMYVFFFRFVGDGRAGRIPATWQARRTKNARTQRLSRVGRRCFYVWRRLLYYFCLFFSCQRCRRAFQPIGSSCISLFWSEDPCRHSAMEDRLHSLSKVSDIYSFYH